MGGVVSTVAPHALLLLYRSLYNGCALSTRDLYIPTWRSRAGFCFWDSFSFIANGVNHACPTKCLFSRTKTKYPVVHMCSSVRKYALPKTSYLPNQTCWAHGVHDEWRKLTSTAIIGTTADHFAALFNPEKRLTDEHYKEHSQLRKLLSTIKTYKSRHQWCSTWISATTRTTGIPTGACL